MKKGIIAVSLLLLSGALLITPITTNASSTQNNIESVISEQVDNTDKSEISNEVKTEIAEIENTQLNVKQEVDSDNTYKAETNNNQSVKVEAEEEIVIEENTELSDEVASNEIKESGMTKTDAEEVLNKYLSETEQSEVTYTYQGDENTFAAMQEKGIRGYVFLPNADTDLAFLVDKDSGHIYYFHPSGYFQLLK